MTQKETTPATLSPAEVGEFMNSIGKVRIEDIIRQRKIEDEKQKVVEDTVRKRIKELTDKLEKDMFTPFFSAPNMHNWQNDILKYPSPSDPSASTSTLGVWTSTNLEKATNQAFKTTQIKRVADIIRGRKSTKELRPFMQKLFKITADI